MNAFHVQRYAICVLGVIALILGACTTIPRIESPEDVILEAKETVLAVKRTIRQNLEDGSYTPDQAEKRLEEVEKVEKQVKDAEVLLKIGKGVEAKDKASIARSLIRNLRSQVEKK